MFRNSTRHVFRNSTRHVFQNSTRHVFRNSERHIVTCFEIQRGTFSEIRQNPCSKIIQGTHVFQNSTRHMFRNLTKSGVKIQEVMCTEQTPGWLYISKPIIQKFRSNKIFNYQKRVNRLLNENIISYTIQNITIKSLSKLKGCLNWSYSFDTFFF